MAFIDIKVDDISVRASLNEKGAPLACQAIWQALPFSGSAVHAQISGDMFRMLEPTPVAEDLPFENQVYTQHPGSVLFFPPIREIAFCIGEATFSAPIGYYGVTPLAEIEDDFSGWAERANNLNFTGAAPIHFSRSEDQETPFRRVVLNGPEIEITFGAVAVNARLLADSLSSASIDRLLSVMPLGGQAANDTWAGPMTIIRPDSPLGLNRLRTERSTIFHWPGYIYYSGNEDRLLVCYGDASYNIQRVPQPLVPVARITDDLSEYVGMAESQLLEGAKAFSIRVT